MNRDGADSDIKIRRVIEAYEVLIFTKTDQIMLIFFSFKYLINVICGGKRKGKYGFDSVRKL